MPTAEQEARAFLAAQRARQRVAAAPPVVPSPAEAADVAAITADVGLPGPVDTLRGMMQPGNVLRGLGEAGGGAIGGVVTKTPQGAKAGSQIGGLAMQPLATGAQRAFDAFTGQPHDASYAEDLAYDAGTNEIANRVLGPVLGKAADLVGSSAPVQGVRKYIAGRVLGRITPDAREALRISEEMIGDLTDAVNRVRQQGARPLYTRDQVEARVEEILPLLQKKGAFTVGDLTTGTPASAIEGVSEGSLPGRSRFGAKREAADVLFEEWPRVFAAMLGDPSEGPDQIARIAAEQIGRSTKRAVGAAGRKIGSVERIVGKNLVPIDESILDGLADEISLYAKRHGGSGDSIALDPERIDQPLKAAIALVEKGTGRRFDFKAGGFSDSLPPELASQPPQVIEAMRAQGVLPAPERTEFTFRDVRKLRSYLGQMEAKIPEAERRSAAASINSLSGALKERMGRVLDAEDMARGNGRDTPRSLRFQWEAGNTAYQDAAELREGFKARAWVESLDKSGSGARVIKEIWPDDIDSERLDNLKALMGGESSPYWGALRRFKMEEFLRSTPDPKALLGELTSSTKHSARYWEETLGADNYKRLTDFGKALKFRTHGQLGRGRIVGSMMDAGIGMQMMDLPVSAATGALGRGTAARQIGRPVSWFVSNRKVAEWLTNPNDSAMFQALLRGSPLKRQKANEWFRNQAARAIADASKEEQPEIRPIPRTVTREGFAAATGRSVGGQ